MPPIRAEKNQMMRVGHWTSENGAAYIAHGLLVRQRIIYDRLPALIDWYGYEVWRGEEKLYWYDSQPHPDDPALQSTHPHHKHIPPEIKHNRIPAPQMSFSHPNLPFLLAEVERLIERIKEESSSG